MQEIGASVYVLRSQTSGRFYIGCTQDVARRLAEHNNGESRSTRGRGPWELVHTERLASLPAARRREAEIKQKKSARYIRWLIQEQSNG